MTNGITENKSYLAEAAYFFALLQVISRNIKRRNSGSKKIIVEIAVEIEDNTKVIKIKK